jgi:hypothetical protein
MPETPPFPDPTVAWNKVHGFLDKLFDALHELEEGGGAIEAARMGGWKPAKLDKAAGSLKAVRDAIDGELVRLKAARKGGMGR